MNGASRSSICTIHTQTPFLACNGYGLVWFLACPPLAPLTSAQRSSSGLFLSFVVLSKKSPGTERGFGRVRLTRKWAGARTTAFFFFFLIEQRHQVVACISQRYISIELGWEQMKRKEKKLRILLPHAYKSMIVYWLGQEPGIYLINQWIHPTEQDTLFSDRNGKSSSLIQSRRPCTYCTSRSL